MNLKFLVCSFFLYLLTVQTTAFSTSTSYSLEVNFSLKNKSENELIDDYNVNWVRTNYENVYKCQGTQIKTEPDLLRLLPRTGEFMATYIYARPSLRPLIGDLISDPLISRITNAYVVFTFSQDQKTGLNLFLWRKGQNKYDELIWSNTAHHPTNGVVKVKVPLKNLTDKFRLLFQAHVTANYQYTFRTYLSQVIIDKVKLKSD